MIIVCTLREKLSSHLACIDQTTLSITTVGDQRSVNVLKTYTFFSNKYKENYVQMNDE